MHAFPVHAVNILGMTRNNTNCVYTLMLETRHACASAVPPTAAVEY